MKLPPGITVNSTIQHAYPLVYKLQKSLYGLRQASRQWYAKLSNALCSRGYIPSLNYYSLFIKKSAASTVFLTVYVHDIVLTVLYDKSGVILHQRKFITDLLREFNCDFVSAVVSPLELCVKLKSDDGELLSKPDTYRSLVGKLNFLTHTRPDLCFAVQHLSQFLKCPRMPHMNAVLHILKYLKGTPHVGGFLNNSSDFSVLAYCDSDWAACSESCRSISGLCISLG
uniref:Uncharacterized mitochondrial protein AtMg00810-like n=1 Tax=Nicotiana tabacum TaxID=4097 RepID=A0A1S4C568_TOBAC|nr:PREDICTED: uncharacterized mitochondrial protein AtMg00810-like [Nicotiana tabacum]